MSLKKERLLLLTLAAVQFTHIMDFMIVMPLGPQFIDTFKITGFQFTLLVSIYSLCAFFSGLLGAVYIDRFDRKTALLFVSVGFTIGTLACAFAPNYHFFLATRGITGMFGGVQGALILAIIGDVIPLERRATAMGTVMAAFSMASVFGVPLGLFLAVKYGWPSPFLFLGCLSILVLVMSMAFVPSMRTHVTQAADRARFQAFKAVLNDRNQLMALLFMVLLIFGQFTIVPFISNYMVDNVGFTQEQLTYIYLLGGGLTIFTSPLIGRWADKAGKLKVFTVFAFIVMIPQVLITNLPPVAVPVALIVTTLFFICAGGRMIPASAMVTATVHARNRGSFMSLNSSMQQAASFFASLLSGIIVVRGDDGKWQNYPVVGLIAVISTIAAIIIARRLKVLPETKPVPPRATP